jgi:sugar phosphate isomerase/epimerase
MERALSTHLLVNHRLTSVWLERIWEAGIPKAEIFCARQHFDYRNKEQVNEIGYWFRDAQLKLHSLHSPMYSDDCWGKTGPGAVVSLTERSKPRRLESVDEVKRALEVAEMVPFKYLVQHLGAAGEEYDDFKLESAFTALEEISLFARHRGVEVLLENIPNKLASAERLLHFLEITHLDLGFCFDTGHAHVMEGVEQAWTLMQDRVRSTHVHDNDGVNDIHYFPFSAQGGTIDWSGAMRLLRSRPAQYPLLLELREYEGLTNPVQAAREVFDRLENLSTESD